MPEQTTQRTTLVLESELHKRLRILALEQGRTLTELVTEALTQYLERETAKARRAKR